MADPQLWFSLVLPIAEYKKWQERQRLIQFWWLLASIVVCSLGVLASVKLVRTTRLRRPLSDRAKDDGTFDEYEL